jgi:MFS family permease
LKDFGDPQSSLKGIIAAAYSLGAIFSLPFIPRINDRFGRRWSIFGGSVIMFIGALIQGFSTHGEHSQLFPAHWWYGFGDTEAQNAI